jgi:hypothetical protein
VAACTDDLDGAWRGLDGRRWMILDEGATLEAYPMFPDGVGSDVLGAPRVIDLSRAGGALAGTVHRRYEHRADSCDARAPATVLACRDGALELLLADPPPPTAFAPCTWPPATPPHAERWTRD